MTSQRPRNIIVEFIYEYQSEGRFHTQKARRPRMRSCHRGRTFDVIGEVKLPDGRTVDCFADTTWGTYAYFNLAGRWFKFKFGTENAIPEDKTKPEGQ